MNIYFSGIGGVGIGPIALVARDMGHRVVGSDRQKSRYTDVIKSEGIEVLIGQSGREMAAHHAAEPIEWFVYTAALPEDHPELVFARQNNIKMSMRGPFVNELIEKEDLQLIAVSGTHGKTTTTGMLIWMMNHLNIPCSYAIGTNISFGPSGRHQEGSKVFVYEADEYAKQFLELSPRISLVANIEHDHPDTYPTAGDYYETFQQFVSQSAETIGWESDFKKSGIDQSTIITGFSRSDDLGSITLPGIHNRENGFLAVEIIRRLYGDDLADKARNSLNSFPGTERRFEMLAENLYTDYGHHPTEIRAVVQMAREITGDLVVVYQPHQNMRQHEIINGGGYGDAFKGAHKVYWLPTYLSREDQSIHTYSPQELADSTITKDIIELADKNSELAEKLSKDIEKDSLVVLISAGDADQWLRDSVTDIVT